MVSYLISLVLYGMDSNEVILVIIVTSTHHNGLAFKLKCPKLIILLFKCLLNVFYFFHYCLLQPGFRHHKNALSDEVLL